MKRRSATAGIGLAAGLLYALLVRLWHLRWGASEDEVHAGLPGDDLIAHPLLLATRAVSVAAPPGDIWPWIAQLGQGGGGFYSYDFLENLVGAGIHSADRVVREWQDIGVGDDLHLAPQIALEVATVDPGKALVLRGGVPIGGSSPGYDFTWAFVLRDGDAGVTRLVLLQPYAYTRWWAPVLVELAEAISAVMSAKMLRGIRRRAEHPELTRAARSASAPDREDLHAGLA